MCLSVPDGEGCLQVLTALAQEQATQGISHGFSDTMVDLLSHYHDQAWCRPTFQQGRSYVGVMIGGLAELPDSALVLIMQQLQFTDLMQLDAATLAQVPVIRERRLQMQYARRWLQLTRRIPRVKPIPCIKTAADCQQSRRVYQRLWQHLQTKSKHSLLQALIMQIRNVNDVAALMDAWVPAHQNWWDCGSKRLGDRKEWLFNEATWYPEAELSRLDMRRI